MVEEGKKASLIVSGVVALRKKGFEKGYSDYRRGFKCMPKRKSPDEYDSYREGYISGYLASEMDSDATLESKVKKVDIEFFRPCEHNECLKHDDTLGKEYFIQSPYEIMEANTLKGHIISANPWVGEKVLVYHNGTTLWSHGMYSVRITKHNYTSEMIYNCMTPCEQRAYDSLPDVFKVYRGYAYPSTKKFSKSLAEQASSWTVDKSIAEFFTQYHTEMKEGALKTALITGIVKKSDILLVMLGRDEAEVLTFADRNVKIINVE